MAPQMYRRRWQEMYLSVLRDMKKKSLQGKKRRRRDMEVGIKEDIYYRAGNSQNHS